MMKFIILILAFILSSPIHASGVESFLEQLEQFRKAAFDAANDRNRAFSDLENQLYGGKLREKNITHKYLQTKDSVTVEFYIPNADKREIQFDVQERAIVIVISLSESKTVDSGPGSFRSVFSGSQQQIVPLPRGIDFEKPKVEQMNDKILFHFKKKPAKAI